MWMRIRARRYYEEHRNSTQSNSEPHIPPPTHMGCIVRGLIASIPMTLDVGLWYMASTANPEAAVPALLLAPVALFAAMAAAQAD